MTGIKEGMTDDESVVQCPLKQKSLIGSNAVQGRTKMGTYPYYSLYRDIAIVQNMEITSENFQV